MLSAVPLLWMIDGSPAHATSIQVTASFDVTANDGLCTLREAITAANTDTASGPAAGECAAGSGADTIRLASNTTYDVTPAANLPPISTDVTIVGNGSTILSRALLRVLQVDAGATTVIRNLTLTHRHSTSGTTGRGFLNRGTSTLRNVTVVDNSEVGHGGGIFNGDDIGLTAAELTIIDSTIEGNSNVPDASSRNGGGIHNHVFATLTVIRSTITDNAADDHGGGISHVGTHLRIEDGLIEANAGAEGGGVYIRPNSPTNDEIVGTDITGNTATQSGGGIHVFGTTVTIEGVSITDNSADLDGGGISSNSSETSITSAQIAGNDAGLFGGGVSGHLGEMTITSSVIEENDAVRGGGGVARFHGETEITSSTIRDNAAVAVHPLESARGGGIFIVGNTTAVRASSIRSNVVRTRGGDPGFPPTASGGGMFADGSDLTLVDTTIDGNTADAGPFVGSARGGGFTQRSGTAEIRNVTISDNAATHAGGDTDGGGMWVDGGSVDTVNATISGNSSDGRGGGISLTDGGDVTMTMTTVTQNTAGNTGGIAAFGTNLSVNASIVAGNVGGEDVEGGIATSGGFNVMGTLDLGGPFSGPGDITGVTDPMLGPLADNGGPTRTHRPLMGSPAIDRVTGGSSFVQPLTDQRGVGRASGPHADSGAVERQFVFTPLEPQRFADSRDEPTFDSRFRNTGPRRAGTVWEIDIAGRGDVHDRASAAIINVTVLNGEAPGFANVYPCGDPPNASSINYAPGAVEPNELIAKLSDEGTVCISTLTDADVVVDVVGLAPANAAYRALTPARFADSRDEPTADGQARDTGIRAGGTTWEIPVAGRGEVPTSATTVAINLTVTEGTEPGFATVYPCGELPLASSLNYGPGVTRPNELIAKLSPTGTICVYTLTDVHVIVDVVGFMQDTLSWTSIVPTRYGDSRDQPTFDGQQRNTGIRQGGTTWEIPIAGRGDVPPTANTAAVNLTVTEGGGPGFATVYPCGDLPLASSLNYGPGVTRPNELIAKLSPAGAICVFTLTDVHVIVDVVGHDG